MASQVLLIRYDYFELEGIPPYPSPFVPVDFSYVWWLSVEDTQRFRYEKRYSTRTEPQSSGLVELSLGDGAGGGTLNFSYWDGQVEASEQGNSAQKVSLEEWLATFTAFGRSLLDKYHSGDLAPFIYKGIYTDLEWGQVHIFEQESILDASDLYAGSPILERYIFDEAQLRQVEWKRIVKAKEGDIIHRLYQLQRWLLLAEEEVPWNIFAKESLEETAPAR